MVLQIPQDFPRFPKIPFQTSTDASGGRAPRPPLVFCCFRFPPPPGRGPPTPTDRYINSPPPGLDHRDRAGATSALTRTQSRANCPYGIGHGLPNPLFCHSLPYSAANLLQPGCSVLSLSLTLLAILWLPSTLCAKITARPPCPFGCTDASPWTPSSVRPGQTY